MMFSISLSNFVCTSIKFDQWCKLLSLWWAVAVFLSIIVGDGVYLVGLTVSYSPAQQSSHLHLHRCYSIYKETCASSCYNTLAHPHIDIYVCKYTLHPFCKFPAIRQSYSKLCKSIADSDSLGLCDPGCSDA